MSSKSFGQRLKLYREKTNLTQIQVANSIGVTAQTVWRWEHGEREPSLDIIKRLVALFRCSEADLLTEEKPQSWTLQIKIADNIKEDFVDMTQDMPCVAAIAGNPYGATLELSGNWETFADDDKFNDFIQQVISSREALLQLRSNMAKSWNK